MQTSPGHSGADAPIEVEIIGLGDVTALRLRSPEQRRALVIRAYYDVLNGEQDFHQALRELVNAHREDLRRLGPTSSKVHSAVVKFASRWGLPADRGAKDVLWSAQFAARIQKSRYRLQLGSFGASGTNFKRVSPHRINKRELRLLALRLRRRLLGWTYSQIADAEIQEGGDAAGRYEDSVRLTVDAWAKELDVRIPRRRRGRPPRGAT